MYVHVAHTVCSPHHHSIIRDSKCDPLVRASPARDEERNAVVSLYGIAGAVVIAETT